MSKSQGPKVRGSSSLREDARFALSRRQFAAGTVAASAALASPALFSGASWAADPKKVTIGPDIEVMVVSDGHLTLPMNFITPDAPAEERAALLKEAGQTGDTYKSPLNVTLIRTPKDLIIVDVGSGAHFMASAGKLGEALGDSGVDREEITKVVFTHAHPDHIWGTVDEFDELQFPNAGYYMSAPERDFWTSDDVLSKLPEDRHSFAIGAKRNIELIQDKMTMVGNGDEISPGVTVMATHGHTPGHISVSVSSGQERLVAIGDAMTHGIISFRHPEWKQGSDYDKDLGVQTRQKLLAEFASDGTQIVGYHLPNGGHGRVVKKGNAYAFESA